MRPQDAPPLGGKAQHTNGRGDHAHLRLGQPQKGTQNHPVNPGAGIALGLDRFCHIGQCGAAPGGLHQLPPQPFRAIGQRRKILLRHGAQPGENGSFSGFQGVRRGIMEQRRRLRGNCRYPAAAGKHLLPQGGGRGGIGVQGGVVIAARPKNGHGFHGAALLQNGLGVLHAQKVVGGGQRPGDAHLRQSLAAGNRERAAGGKRLPQQRGKFRGAERPGGLQQRLCIHGFRAEAQPVTAAGGNGNASGGKPLGGGQGNFGGKLQHQVSAAKNGGPGTDGLVNNGRSAPLDVVAAHQADNGSILTPHFPDAPELGQMPIVKGVIFANYTNNFQPAYSFDKKFLFGG